MDHVESLHEFLDSISDKHLKSRSAIRALLPDLLSHLGFEEYSLDSDAEDSIADVIVRPTSDDMPVIAIQFGYNPEADEHGPHLPHRPSHVHYPTEDQILGETSVGYVITLSNTTLAIRGGSYARTIVFCDVDKSLDGIPTYESVDAEVVEEVIRELRSGRTRPQPHTGQKSLSDF